MDKLGWSVVVTLGIALLYLVGAIRGGGIFSRTRKLAGAALFGAVAVLLAALYGSLNACVAFSGESLVGTVQTQPAGSDAFDLIYQPTGKERPAASDTKAKAAAKEGLAQEPHRMRLRGDQWVFSGAVVKWHPVFGLLGVRSYHRPLRIAGQFSSIDKQRSERPTVESIGPGKDALWEALYWLGPKLPFLDAVYGSSAYGYVDPRSVQEVYVTATGYLIKRRTRN